MVSQGKPIAITLLKDPWPLERASQTGTMTLSDDKTEMTVWDLFTPMGADATGGSTHQKMGDKGWIVVVVNSLKEPLTVDCLLLPAGTQTGFAAVTDFTTMVPNTGDQIPGVRDHPTNAGEILTAAGAWTFTGDTFSMAMKLSRPGKGEKTFAAAIKMGFLWINPVSAVTADLEFYRKTPTDGDAELLQQFFDANTGSQGPYFEIKNETIWGTIGGMLKNCLVVWIR